MTASKTPIRISRRRFAGSATAAVGVVAASNYVKPEMRALGIPTAYAQVSPSPSTDITITVDKTKESTVTPTRDPHTPTPRRTVVPPRRP